MATAIPPVISQASWLQRFGPILARFGLGPGQGRAAAEALGMGQPEAAPAAAPAAPAPVQMAQAQAPQEFAPVDDIGMGIAVPQDEQVTASDLGWSPSFTPAPTRAVPMATAPASRRFSSTRPEFIYTNPAAASQAASNYAARMGFESAQDQGYRDYLSRLSGEQGATERANVQAQIYGNQLMAAGREGAANRASAERIATTAETVRMRRAEEAQRAEQDRAAEIGEQTAAMLNADPNAKVDRKWVWVNPATGKWESRFKRPPQRIASPIQMPAQAPVLTAPIPAPTAPAQVAVATPAPAPTVGGAVDMSAADRRYPPQWWYPGIENPPSPTRVTVPILPVESTPSMYPPGMEP